VIFTIFRFMAIENLENHFNSFSNFLIFKIWRDFTNNFFVLVDLPRHNIDPAKQVGRYVGR